MILRGLKNYGSTLDWRIFLSSFLIVLSFPPWDLDFLLWVCLIPWFSSLRQTTAVRHAVRRGLELGMLMTLLGFYWVGYVLHQFGNLNWPLSCLGLFFFGFICQLQFPIFSGFFRLFAHPFIEKRPFQSLLPLALLYVGIDAFVPKLFEDTLGHALYQSTNLRQLVDLAGPRLLTFLVVLINLSIWSFCLNKKFQIFILPAVFLLGGIIYGHIKGDEIQNLLKSPISRVQAGVIQGNIGDFEKIASERGIPEAGKKVMDTYLQLSEQALSQTPSPDFLVWPETAYPAAFRTPRTSEEMAREQQIEKFVRSKNIPLLFGGYDQADQKDYNSLFLLAPKIDGSFAERSQLAVYHKHILLLFGEYIPGADSIALIKNIFPQVGNFGRGSGPESLILPLSDPLRKQVKIGPAICYEVLSSSYILETALKGNQILLNITNDSWFGPFGEPELHLALATFRSIETRLPMIRSTNTGYSALILPDGQITQKSKMRVAQVLNFSVPIIAPSITVIKKLGNWFGGAALALSALYWMFIFFRYPNNRFSI